MSLESTGGRNIDGGFHPQEMIFLSYASLAVGETSVEHGGIMDRLDTYLALVPVGVRDEFTEQITPGLRTQLFEEREHSCEACNVDLTEAQFDIHHTDYTNGSNPEYLKVLCKPCHSVVGVLTGLKWWFAQEVGLVEKQDESRRIGRKNSHKIYFWMEPGFIKDEPLEEE